MLGSWLFPSHDAAVGVACKGSGVERYREQLLCPFLGHWKVWGAPIIAYILPSSRSLVTNIQICVLHPFGEQGAHYAHHISPLWLPAVLLKPLVWHICLELRQVMSLGSMSRLVSDNKSDNR